MGGIVLFIFAILIKIIQVDMKRKNIDEYIKNNDANPYSYTKSNAWYDKQKDKNNN